MNDLEEAMEEYSSWTENEPENAKAWLKLARVALKRSMLSDAKTYATKGKPYTNDTILFITR